MGLHLEKNICNKYKKKDQIYILKCVVFVYVYRFLQFLAWIYQWPQCLQYSGADVYMLYICIYFLNIKHFIALVVATGFIFENQ